MHRKTQAVDLMIAEALTAANPVYKFDEMVRDRDSYVNLSDYVIREIEMSKDPVLEKSRNLIRRIKQRKLFIFVAESLINSTQKIEPEENIKLKVISYAKSNGAELKFDEFYILSSAINYSMKDKNPVDYVKFYKTGAQGLEVFTLGREQVSLLIPENFNEKILRIFVSDSSKIDVAKEAFKNYIEKDLKCKVGAVDAKPTPAKPTPVKRLNFIGVEPELKRNKVDLGGSNSNSQTYNSQAFNSQTFNNQTFTFGKH